jgi:hypothetical protein
MWFIAVLGLVGKRVGLVMVAGARHIHGHINLFIRNMYWQLYISLSLIV